MSDTTAIPKAPRLVDSPRTFRRDEKEFLSFVLKQGPDGQKIIPKLDSYRVQTMDDGGMGSVFVFSDKVDDRRLPGKRIGEARFNDVDGMLVWVTIGLDQFGALYEIDVWRVDFSPSSPNLFSAVKPEDIETGPPRPHAQQTRRTLFRGWSSPATRLLCGGILLSIFVAIAVASESANIGLLFALGAVLLYGLAALVIASRLGPLAGTDFGAANTVTLVRLVLTCLYSGLAFVLMDQPLSETMAWIFFAIAVGAMALDGCDGWLARRTNTVSAFGARFDMEVDALLIMLLSLIAFETGKAGAWVLLSGAARYLYVAAGFLWPALTHPVFPSFARKTVAVIQAGVLTALLMPPVTSPLSDVLAAGALGLLILSFGRDILWQVAQRRIGAKTETVATPAP